MGKILRKSQHLISKIKCFCWPNINGASFFHSKLKRGEFKFECTQQRKCKPFQPVYFSKSSENFKKILDSLLGKVKKIKIQVK